MKTKLQILVAGVLLATVGEGLSQPCITITNQPQNQTPCYGTTANFKVGATGAEPLSYQWQQSGDGANFTDRPAATKSTLEIPNVQGSDTGIYRAIVANAQCTVTSLVATLFPAYAPSISTSGQPTNWPLVTPGVNLTNRVIAGGSLLNYQWRLNGGPLSGQTKSTIILTSVQLADKGDYDVVVANPCGSITSRVVTLEVTVPLFTRMTNELRFPQADAAAFVWFDYDNDGWADVLCGGGWYGGYGNRLFHNNQNGTFTQVSESNFPGQGDHTCGNIAAKDRRAR